jgi:hypothetical protein
MRAPTDNNVIKGFVRYLVNRSEHDEMGRKQQPTTVVARFAAERLSKRSRMAGTDNRTALQCWPLKPGKKTRLDALLNTEWV